jgi:hypothetical protein
MAIWQWDVWIIPKTEVLKLFSTIPEFMDLDWFESVEWWNNVSKIKLKTTFESLLPNYDTPWAKNTQSWGSDEGDRIELRIEDEKIIDVVIRVDLRELNVNFLHSLVKFSEFNDFLFYSFESNKFIEPDSQKLLGEIKKSRKITFLQNPENFFEDKTYLDKINKENLGKLEKED